MDWRKYIETNDEVLAGKPALRGTRISVEHVINLMASGWTEEQIIQNYPRITRENLQAVFSYIQEIIQDGLIFNDPEKSAS